MSLKVKADKLTAKHGQLTHSENLKVSSHVQRKTGDWILNTVTVDGYDAPFRFKRKTRYKNIEVVRIVVRIKVS